MCDNRTITDTLLENYVEHLRYQERSQATMTKYERDVRKFMVFAGGREITKLLAIEYKEHLKQLGYEPASVNSMLASVNGFLAYCGLGDCAVNRMKIQKKVFCDKEQELTKGEYLQLLEASNDQEHERINLVVQTLCGTGIRVSELRYITVESVRSGHAVVECKGKVRKVFIPEKLLKRLRQYVRRHGVATGPVFVTRTGRPLNRSNIWREMKALCRAAGVNPKKVFPHNLRHLFARSFYALEKDIAKLADILGHSNIETTRVYILSSGSDHEKQVNRLGLVV